MPSLSRLSDEAYFSQRDNAFEASSSRAYISVEFDDFPMTNDHIRSAFDLVDCHLPDPFLEAVIVPTSVTERDTQLICKKYAVSAHYLAVIGHESKHIGNVVWISHNK